MKTNKTDETETETETTPQEELDRLLQDL